MDNGPRPCYDAPAMLLQDKTAIIFGVANHRSAGWHMAQAFHREGARVLLTYQNERLEKDVRKLAEEIGARVSGPCDVTHPDELQAVYQSVEREWPEGLDILVHSLAFAPREALEGHYLDTSREAFGTALEISAHSLASLTRPAAPLMEQRGGGSVITLTYLGAERVFPNYNVMGVAKAALEASVRYLASDLGPKNIRVNAISAGPMKTLSGAGIKDFRDILEVIPQRAPLRRNIDQDEVADVGVFLASHLSRGITGEVIHVDAGFHIMGM
jgi:enoyl-[acyl-carrier protein] reductase I